MHEHHDQCDHEHYEIERNEHPASTNELSRYQNHGIEFQYPSSWQLDEQSSGEEVTITAQSPGTSFWTVVIFASQPDPDEVLDTVVAAFEQDYEDVDVQSFVGSVCGVPALGRDLDFVCYDLINCATLRAFQTTDQTVLVLYQGTDHELENTRESLESITRSLRSTSDDDDLQEFA